MGTIRHNVIIVTCDSYNHKDMIKVHMKAVELFGMLVTSITSTPTNGFLTFFIAPDGSKEGWGESNEHDIKRKELCDYIDTFAYKDGSSSFKYVDVCYGETFDGNTTYVEKSNLKLK